jgi:hypothetical protein
MDGIAGRVDNNLSDCKDLTLWAESGIILAYRQQLQGANHAITNHYTDPGKLRCP